VAVEDASLYRITPGTGDTGSFPRIFILDESDDKNRLGSIKGKNKN